MDILMAMSAQDREYVEAVAELSAERAATKAVDKMAKIMGGIMHEHKEDCEARAVWKRVRNWMLVGILSGTGVVVGITELIRHWTG